MSNKENKKIKMIIDTDPGIDDAMAILFAEAHPDIELIGLTTVFGNATIDTVTRNALYLKKQFNLSCDVAKGATKPLQGESKPPVAHIHGDNGLGNIALDYADLGQTHQLSAVDYLIEQIRKHPNEITLVPVGPLTNIALALEKAPDIAELVKEIIIMGGAFGYHGHGGNITPVAEANIYCDPWAADILFTSKAPVTVVGLDVTNEVIMSPDYFEQLKAQSHIGSFIYDIAQFYLNFYRTNNLGNGCATHDPLAIMYPVAPEFFTTITAPIRVVTEGITKGQTVKKLSERNYAIDEWDIATKKTICIDVERESCLKLYKEILANFKK